MLPPIKHAMKHFTSIISTLTYYLVYRLAGTIRIPIALNDIFKWYYFGTSCIVSYWLTAGRVWNSSLCTTWTGRAWFWLLPDCCCISSIDKYIHIIIIVTWSDVLYHVELMRSYHRMIRFSGLLICVNKAYLVYLYVKYSPLIMMLLKQQNCSACTKISLLMQYILTEKQSNHIYAL